MVCRVSARPSSIIFTDSYSTIARILLQEHFTLFYLGQIVTLRLLNVTTEALLRQSLLLEIQ